MKHQNANLYNNNIYVLLGVMHSFIEFWGELGEDEYGSSSLNLSEGTDGITKLFIL